MKIRHHSLAIALLTAPPIAFAQGGGFAGPTIAGIPVEFILFATILLGVALFHHYTFPIAAGGAGVCRWIRRLDDLVRFIGRHSALEHVSEARSVGRWVRHGWPVAVAYVVGFFEMHAIIGWHPGSTPRGSAPVGVQQPR